jgi:hypothetical protein
MLRWLLALVPVFGLVLSVQAFAGTDRRTAQDLALPTGETLSIRCEETEAAGGSIHTCVGFRHQGDRMLHLVDVWAADPCREAWYYRSCRLVATGYNPDSPISGTAWARYTFHGWFGVRTTVLHKAVVTTTPDGVWSVQ